MWRKLPELLGGGKSVESCHVCGLLMFWGVQMMGYPKFCLTTLTSPKQMSNSSPTSRKKLTPTSECLVCGVKFGNGPNTVRRARVQTPNSVSFSGLTEFRGANSVSSSQPIIFVCKNELTEFSAELTEFAVKLSEFSSPKQCSRNSIPPV